MCAALIVCATLFEWLNAESSMFMQHVVQLVIIKCLVESAQHRHSVGAFVCSCFPLLTMYHESQHDSYNFL